MHRLQSFTVALFLISFGCGLPRDSEGTLHRVRNGTMRVGVSSNAPWVMAVDSGFSGYEATMVGELARDLNSRIEVHSGAESVLLEDLHNRKLDVVVGGLTADSRWKKDVALTTPYHTDREGKKHVLALPLGENQWLVRVEEYLRDNEARLKAIPE